jgi:hypothetical protein
MRGSLKGYHLHPFNNFCFLKECSTPPESDFLHNSSGYKHANPPGLKIFKWFPIVPLFTSFIKVYVVKLFTYFMKMYVVLLCFLYQGLIPPGGFEPLVGWFISKAGG